VNLQLEEALDVATADLRYAQIHHRFYGTDESEEVLACARYIHGEATRELQRYERRARRLEVYAQSIGYPLSPVRLPDEEPAIEDCIDPTPDWALSGGSPSLYTYERNEEDWRYENGRSLDHG
jgi:hypothetical protein